MKIGIFGGTCNPPHISHVNILSQAKSQLGLDKLIVFPCGNPPHKKCEVDKSTRLELTRLAFDGIAEVDDYELNRDGKSYTVNTLNMLRNRYPNDELYLIIGGDSFRDFDKWYHAEEICTMCTLAVAERSRKTSKATLRKIQRLGAKVTFVSVKPTNVSSTEVRLRYQFGLENGQFVPQAVDEYVKTHNLYAEYLPMATKLKGYLKPERFSHTFYVVKRGLELATEEEKHQVFVACLLHDCAKYIAPCDYAKYGFVRPSDMPNNVVHAFLGALVAEQDFGVTDKEVIEAIRYHCTAKPDMSRLQMLLYVADKTEQTRKYPLSHLLKGSLENMFKLCLEEASQYCGQVHADSIYPLTQQAVDFYLKK